MPKFDIWSSPGKRLTAIKVKRDNTSKIDGSIYLATLISSTKSSALTQANTRVQSGLIKFPKSDDFSSGDIKKSSIKELIKPDVMKKGIYCDFNGVLDDIDKDSNEHSASFRVPKLACPHKIMKVTKLALKHNADLIMTSEWRKQGITYYCVIARCLLNCGIQEYVDFYNENQDAITELCMVSPTDDFSERTNEIRYHINECGYSHFVVFEDSHFIEKDLNPIITQWSVGLLDEHIERADIILSKEF
jgi:hypothetical protein